MANDAISQRIWQSRALMETALETSPVTSTVTTAEILTSPSKQESLFEDICAEDNSQPDGGSEVTQTKGNLKTTEISVGDVKVRVRTDATPSALRQIRELVDSRREDFADKSVKGLSAHQLTVLVAFSLAEEVLKEREKVRQLKRRVAEYSERLIERVESHLGKDLGT